MERREFLSATGVALAAMSVGTRVSALQAFQRPASPFARFDAQARALLGRMTLEEKVGQMVQAEFSALKNPRDVQIYFLGSLLAGGNGDPKSGNTLLDWTNAYDTYQALAIKTRLGIPLLFGVDALHGHNNVLGAVIFPHNIGLGCSRNASLVEQAARITAEEMRATGVNWAFAPCVTVPRDKRWGRTYEGFGESPDLARSLGEAAVRGLQTANLAGPTSVAACAKHFAGDGGTTFGTGTPFQDRRMLDQGDTRLSETELRDFHLQGYIGAIDAGVATIMPSYNSWNGEKVSGSKRLLTDILKLGMGFGGLLISDYNAVDQLPGDYKAQIARSANAGMDMFMVPDKYVQLHGLLLALAKEGTVPLTRIDDAVVRILRVKFAMGLMGARRAPLADRTLHRSFGSAAHRAVARKCVQQSVVLLKNDPRTLPLSKTLARVHVAGRSADNIGNQCGGWTIDWQGKTGDVTPGGTTILNAVRRAVSSSTRVTTSVDGTGAEGADIAIVVIGELPYAEFMGDVPELALAAEDVAAVQRISRAGTPVVVVLMSGRPLPVDPIVTDCRALVAAWLPGTEGQGVTDVLFGDVAPVGTLSVSWPRAGQGPVNVNDRTYDPMFPYGFGLGY
ncbi:MAG: glycoside hydrolase family 3 protein [Acidobacteriota bacterium]